MSFYWDGERPYLEKDDGFFRDITEDGCLDRDDDGSVIGEFLENPAERAGLVAYCRLFLTPRSTTNKDLTSYGLKHMAERFLGYYVSNSDIKAALILLGFEPYMYKKEQGKNWPNWSFNVSKQSPGITLDLKYLRSHDEEKYAALETLRRALAKQR